MHRGTYENNYGMISGLPKPSHLPTFILTSQGEQNDLPYPPTPEPHIQAPLSPSAWHDLKPCHLNFRWFRLLLPPKGVPSVHYLGTSYHFLAHRVCRLATDCTIPARSPTAYIIGSATATHLVRNIQ